MTPTSPVVIVHLYPDLLGTYGDGGNVEVLAARLRWRGVPVHVEEVLASDPIPTSGDLYVLGGGEDAGQETAAGLLRAGGLDAILARGVTCLAVCAGLQLLGEHFTSASGLVVAGVGAIDAVSERSTIRAVGEAIVEPDLQLDLPTLTGFENHGGITRLGPSVRPLGQVRQGKGNGDGATMPGDGCWREGIIGTYLHGPVLARNPALADWLLARATGAPLSALDVPEVSELRAERLRSTTRPVSSRWWTRAKDGPDVTRPGESPESTGSAGSLTLQSPWSRVPPR